MCLNISLWVTLYTVCICSVCVCVCVGLYPCVVCILQALNVCVFVSCILWVPLSLEIADPKSSSHPPLLPWQQLLLSTGRWGLSELTHTHKTHTKIREHTYLHADDKGPKHTQTHTQWPGHKHSTHTFCVIIALKHYLHTGKVSMRDKERAEAGVCLTTMFSIWNHILSGSFKRCHWVHLHTHTHTLIPG